MSNSTVYDVQIRYVLDDRAGAALEGLGAKAERTERSLDGIKSGLAGVAALFVGGAAFHKGKEMFVDFNSEMESMRISAAAMLQANDLAKTFDEATGKAQGLVNEFQRFAVTSPVTTKELFSFSNGVSSAVAEAGGGIKDITKLTEQGVIAAKAFGAQADYAALELTEGIQRGGTVRMRFLKQLLATQHTTMEEFNRLGGGGEGGAAARMALLMKAVDSPAMRSAAKAFGDSFVGVTSTLKDNLEILGGKVGLPLFKAITAEVKEWNHWIEQHPRELANMIDRTSKALVTGFRALKDGVGFVLDHKDELIMIASLWAANKVGAGMGELVSGVRLLNDSSAQAAGNVSSFGSKLGSVVGSLGMLYVALNYIAGKIDENQKEGITRGGDVNAINDRARADMGNRGDAMAYLGLLKEMGVTPQMGQQDAMRKLSGLASQGGAEMAGYGDLSMKDKEAWIRFQADQMFKAFDTYKRTTQFRPDELDAAQREKSDVSNGKMKSPGSVNITINKVEVASEDPDRFAIGLTRVARRVNANPTQADSAWRGAF